MATNLCNDPYLPLEAEIIDRTQETSNIFTLHIRFVDCTCHERFLFIPGQFNMVYLYGVGEVAISIVSDPEEKNMISHTIRTLGRVTKALRWLLHLPHK